MTAKGHPTALVTWVAIDIAKKWNTVLVEDTQGCRHKFKMANSVVDHDKLVAYLHQQPGSSRIAMEPTGTYHRPLAYRLRSEGFDVCLVSSLAAARYREATYNSWDKNDPKDAAVILDLLMQGKTLLYYDSFIEGVHDIQELSKTYMQTSLAKTRLQHSLLTHYLPLYWPEFDRYWHASRTAWIARFLNVFPVPSTVRQLTCRAFIRKAGPLVGRKVNKAAWLSELYDLADRTIGLPVPEDSVAVSTFRMQLTRYLELIRTRRQLEEQAETMMGSDGDYMLLKSIPGIGTVLAMTILAEAGDLRRFGHHRQFLKYCGFDLAKSQSGGYRGRERLSKRGNARLRCAFWMAGTRAARMQENSFRAKFGRYMRNDPDNRDRRRKALTAVAAKMARVAYAIVKSGTPYRVYHEAELPSGSIPVKRAVEAARTS